MKPYGERRAQGIADQNDTHRRLREDFPTLHIWNNTTNRKRVDFEITFPGGYVERVEHKAWAGHYRMTIQHYLDTRTKFKGKKGGTIYFTRPQEETHDATVAMDRDKRTRVHGYGELKNLVQNLNLSHSRPAVWSSLSIRKWHDRSFMRQPYGAMGRRVSQRPVMRYGLWVVSTSLQRYRAVSLSGLPAGVMDAYSGWDDIEDGYLTIGELQMGTSALKVPSTTTMYDEPSAPYPHIAILCDPWPPSFAQRLGTATRKRNRQIIEDMVKPSEASPLPNMDITPGKA